MVRSEKRRMKTRLATAAEFAAYKKIYAESHNAREVRRLARLFYDNKHGFESDAHAEDHKKACARWNEELAAVGFRLSTSGLRVFVGPRTK